MRHILILGASGQIARHVVQQLQQNQDIQLTLMLRDASKLADMDTTGMRVVQADVSDVVQLQAAMQGQYMVYANLAGEVDVLAARIVTAMQQAAVQRLVFVTSLGIYDEVPGAFGVWNNRMIGEDLKPYRRAADLIEQSALDYTIVRPAWLTDHDEVDYETTQKGQPFKGTEVSRKSVAAYIVQVLLQPALASRASIGLNKPGTDADKPAFY